MCHIDSAVPVLLVTSEEEEEEEEDRASVRRHCSFSGYCIRTSRKFGAS